MIIKPGSRPVYNPLTDKKLAGMSFCRQCSVGGYSADTGEEHALCSVRFTPNLYPYFSICMCDWDAKQERWAAYLAASDTLPTSRVGFVLSTSRRILRRNQACCFSGLCDSDRMVGWLGIKGSVNIKWVAGAGASSCTSCAAGRFANNSGKSSLEAWRVLFGFLWIVLGFVIWS